MDNSLAAEWLHLLLRWFHVFAGILWIGATWYFTWLDFRFHAAQAELKPGEGPALVWMVHSGGFYRVEKLARPQVDPDRIHWFKWEAAFTWISGILLLTVVYYLGGSMTDPDVSSLSHGQAVAVGLGAIVGGWLVYDLLWLTLLHKDDRLGAAVGFALALGAAWGLLHLLPPRAAFIHMGALFGTLMAANVWVRILPAQSGLVAALRQGGVPPAALAERAKQRSKHNTFLVVPLVFLMISNHFPVATYGNDHAFAILAALIGGGWVVAGLVRGRV